MAATTAVEAVEPVAKPAAIPTGRLVTTASLVASSDVAFEAPGETSGQTGQDDVGQSGEPHAGDFQELAA